MSKTNSSKINSDIIKMLVLAIILSVFFVLGIPIIIVSAISGSVLPLVLGILFTVFGFYGMPFAWISFGNLKNLRRVVDAVMEEHLTTNKEVAQQLQISEKVAKESITKAINKRYITGFIYDGEALKPNENSAPKKKVVLATNNCLRCGAPIEIGENNMRCPYCGAKYKQQ